MYNIAYTKRTDSEKIKSSFYFFSVWRRYSNQM